MSADTKIEWTDRTWNPIRGCALVSEGCRNCYAMKQAHRFSGAGQAYEGLTELGPAGPRWTGKIRTVEDVLTEPLRWGLKKEPCERCMGAGSLNDWKSCGACSGRGWTKRGLRIFVNSMSDLFHEDVPDAFIERVFSVMGLAERHTFQVLTKRPDRMLAWFSARRFDVKRAAILQTEIGECHYAMPWPLPNVWLGVSCENQETADERIPLLLQTPAVVRFISAEPLLGEIDLTCIEWLRDNASDYFNSLRRDRNPYDDVGLNGAALDWVIVGGESGPKARECEIPWIRSIVQQCASAGVACFVKQIGSRPFTGNRPYGGNMTIGGRGLFLIDKKGGDIEEWAAYPETADLRVRQFPVGSEMWAQSAEETQ